jgi:addiction module HigA family antidote
LFIPRPGASYDLRIADYVSQGAKLDDESAPVTPGQMMKHEFLAEYGLSQHRLAEAIGISPKRLTEIVHNRRRITADTAIRLGLYCGNSPESWINLQTHYDLGVARRAMDPTEVAKTSAPRFS